MASSSLFIHLSLVVLVCVLSPLPPSSFTPSHLTDAVAISANDTTPTPSNVADDPNTESSVPKPLQPNVTSDSGSVSVSSGSGSSSSSSSSSKNKRNESFTSYVIAKDSSIDLKDNNNSNNNKTDSGNGTAQTTATVGDDDDDDEVDEEEHDDHPRFTFETFVTISVTLLTVLSNCTIIIVAAWTEAFNNYNKIFIYSMSLADLLIGLFVTPYSIFLSIYRKWVFVGGLFCNIEAYVLLTLHGAKLFSLTWLNVDHYIAVRKPERYNVMMSKTRSVCWIIISWLAAICFFMPPMLSFKSSFFNRSIYLCQADTKEQIAYILTSVILVSIPALLALTITNIYLFTPGYKKRIRFYEKVFVELSTRPWNYHTTFVMCAVIVVLWVPFCLLRFFLTVSEWTVDSRAEFYLCWLGFCCSFSNFLVLFFMCTAFRQAVWEMYGLYDWCPSWCCCCSRNRTQRHHHRYSSDVNVITLTRKR